MSNEAKKPNTSPPLKKLKASPNPAVLTALALLSVSLRVTDGNPAEDLSGAQNAGSNAAGVKVAAAHKSNVNNSSATNHTSAATNKATGTSSKFKFTTTTKDKTDTFLQYKPSNQHSSPSPGSRRK